MEAVLAVVCGGGGGGCGGGGGDFNISPNSKICPTKYRIVLARVSKCGTTCPTQSQLWPCLV